MEDEEASDGSEPDDERWFPYVLNGREQHVRQAHVQDQVKNDEHMVPHLHLVLGKRALTIPPAIEETNDAPAFLARDVDDHALHCGQYHHDV